MNVPATIEWTAAMETGVAEIDEQHRLLVDILNRAITRMCESDNARQFDAITKDLLGYAIFHFETEEELMRQHAYADADAAQHRLAHRAFSARVAELRAGLGQGAASSREALLHFLRDWLNAHILGTDKDVADHILRSRQPRP
jgi:hemerythrin-like metal-binding protein